MFTGLIYSDLFQLPTRTPRNVDMPRRGVHLLRCSKCSVAAVQHWGAFGSSARLRCFHSFQLPHNGATRKVPHITSVAWFRGPSALSRKEKNYEFEGSRRKWTVDPSNVVQSGSTITLSDGVFRYISWVWDFAQNAHFPVKLAWADNAE